MENAPLLCDKKKKIFHYAILSHRISGSQTFLDRKLFNALHYVTDLKSLSR